MELPFFGNAVAADAPLIMDSVTGKALYTYGKWCDQITGATNAFGKAVDAERGLVMVFADVSTESLMAIHVALASEKVVALANAEICGSRREALLDAYAPDAVMEPVTTKCSTDWSRLGYTPVTATDLPASLGVWRSDGIRSNSSTHPDLTLMLSTSGSTGSPKYVRLDKESVLHNAAAIAQGLDLGPGDVGLANLPFAYTYGLSVLFSHFVSGAAVAIADIGVLDSDFLAACDKLRCTSIAGVPFAYTSMRRFGVEIDSLPTLRQCTQAGGKLALEDVRYFTQLLKEAGKAFRVMYGQTEATARISIMPLDAQLDKVGSVGLPIADTGISIEPIDQPEDGSENLIGEVVVSGPGVMMGYATSRVDLSRGDELEGVLHTGDLGRLDDEGFLYIEGRLGRFVKVFGNRVDLDQIQAVFSQGTAAAVDAGEDRVLVAVESAQAPGDAETVRQMLLDEFRLPAWSVRVALIDHLPRTSSGKLDYASIRNEVRAHW